MYEWFREVLQSHIPVSDLGSKIHQRCHHGHIIKFSQPTSSSVDRTVEPNSQSCCEDWKVLGGVKDT